MSKRLDESLGSEELDNTDSSDNLNDQHSQGSDTTLEKNLSLTKLEEEILYLLMGREMYGLQIVQAYEQVSQGKRKLSIGTLYPTLSRMEGRGLVTSHLVSRPEDDKGGARRKLFRITLQGSRALNHQDDFRKALHAWQPT
ncbi:MAG: PadR family transcriptional regulator [Cyanobacteria bacterium J06638_22]